MGKNKMRSIYEKEEIIQDYLRSGQKGGATRILSAICGAFATTQIYYTDITPKFE